MSSWDVNYHLDKLQSYDGGRKWQRVPEALTLESAERAVRRQEKRLRWAKRGRVSAVLAAVGFVLMGVLGGLFWDNGCWFFLLTAVASGAAWWGMEFSVIEDVEDRLDRVRHRYQQLLDEAVNEL